jgi:hypothetical protein
MSANETKSSRRRFLTQGGAALGAGIATTAVAGAAESQLEATRRQLAGAQAREAIRQLHLAFTALMESGRYETAAGLFDAEARLRLSDASASGRRAIEALFADQYRGGKARTLHSAYRQSGLQRQDAVVISEDQREASATFHVEVELSTPLRGDSTIVEMARLQGNVADRRWESGRFEARYVNSAGQWKIASLDYLAS